jgi:hypothetical protein
MLDKIKEAKQRMESMVPPPKSYDGKLHRKEWLLLPSAMVGVLVRVGFRKLRNTCNC